MVGSFISKWGVGILEEEESARLCVFMLVCFARLFPLAPLSDIWQGDFLACGQAERGKHCVRRQAA